MGVNSFINNILLFCASSDRASLLLVGFNLIIPMFFEKMTIFCSFSVSVQVDWNKSNLLFYIFN